MTEGTVDADGNIGLNKLKGFDVTEFHIMLEAQNGRNMNGTVYIPNPSVMTITMVRSTPTKSRSQ